MPKGFENCVKRGGKVRRVSGPSKKHGLEKNEYVNYCTIDGKTYRGEVKKKKSENSDNKEGSMDVLNFKTKDIPKKVPKRALWFDESNEQVIEFKGAEQEEKKGSIVGYSGQPMNHWLFGKIAVDVDGISFTKNKKKFPILEEHQRDRKIGFSKKPKTDENQLVIDEFTVLDNAVANEFYNNATKGYPYQASISIKPSKIEELTEKAEAEVNGYNLKGPALIIRQSEYRETSVCTFGADTNTSSTAFSEDEEYEELDIEVVENYTEDYNHEDYNFKSEQEDELMDLNELKKKHPELVTQLTEELRGAIQSEFSGKLKEKDDKITELEKEKETLSNSNTELSDRVQKLEKNDTIRTEREIKANAKSVVEKRLSQTSFSDRIKDKIRQQFSHEKFVDENNSFDIQKFTEHVDSEVKDWEASLEESGSNKVDGYGFTENKEGESEFSETKVDEVTNRLLDYVSKGEKENK